MEERKIALKRLREIWEEFRAHYDRLHAFYHDSVAGFVLFRTTVASDQETERGLSSSVLPMQEPTHAAQAPVLDRDKFSLFNRELAQRQVHWYSAERPE